MPDESAVNLLKNPSFDAGADQPEGWQWTVVRGNPLWPFPAWTFDESHRHGGTRSIKIVQDVGAMHSEFRQNVPCVGGRRYRLSGWIRCTLEGDPDYGGAALGLRSFAGGTQIHDLYFKPFVLGCQDWTLWSCEYVPPPLATELLVSLEVRDAHGAAWFDALELCAVPEPLARSVAPLTVPARTPASVRRSRSVRVLAAHPPQRLLQGLLAPLLGAANVKWSPLTAPLPEVTEDALLILADDPLPASMREPLLAFAQQRVAVICPQVLPGIAGAEVRVERVERRDRAPCAKIERESFLTRGFRAGDVAPWWTGADGSFQQVQVRSANGVLKTAGFETHATSFCGSPVDDRHAVILWRPSGQGGGIAVLDLAALDARPGWPAQENLACLVLTNALGLPQVTLGGYVVPQFDYAVFCQELQQFVKQHHWIELREEGRSAVGRPMYSLALGPADAPVFWVDCGIHPDEWAATYGVLFYLARLHDEYERGRPWARALLRRLRFKCMPVVAVDGWQEHIRYLHGVDLNRNFPIGWREYGGGSKGSSPLSQRESSVLARIFEDERIVAAVNFHETSAGTNWIGHPGQPEKYARYLAAVPALFRQLVERRHFFWQAATWTQVGELRSYQYQFLESFPYLRNYGPPTAPFAMNYADRLGIESLLVEMYGNGDFNCSNTPQRTDIAAQVIEMLFGLQLGLLCRNPGDAELKISVPMACNDGGGELIVCDAEGREVERRTLTASAGRTTFEAVLPPAGVGWVELAEPHLQEHLAAKAEAVLRWHEQKK